MNMRSALYSTNTFRWNLIVLRRWNNNSWVDMLPHSDILSWSSSQSVFVVLDASTLTITPPMWFIIEYNVNQMYVTENRKAIKNGQSRETDNIWHTRHRTKTNKAKQKTKTKRQNKKLKTWETRILLIITGVNHWKLKTWETRILL